MGSFLNRIHHVAVICSDYEKSKAFYTDMLGFQIGTETYRHDRQSYKLDLTLHGAYTIELFSFPQPPPRITQPEAAGLRHLAFEVDDLNEAVEALLKHNVMAEPIRLDEITNKRFTFIFDPDMLPIELYEK